MNIMSVFYASIILALVNSAASHRATPVPVPSTTLFQPLSKACKVGDISGNECNKCICTPDFYYKCISIPCNITEAQSPKNKTSCEPDKLYIMNLTGCLCKPDGSWPHETCKTIFDSYQVKTQETCKPNTFAIVGCNVCKCGPNGRINKKRCTKNKCEPNITKRSRRYIQQNQVYGSCDAQNWYSLAPCQFCFCVSENKLVCNTGNNYAKKLQLGSYNLSICGKDIIRDAMNLIPEGDQALRFGSKSKANELHFIEVTTEHHGIMEINGETNEKALEHQKEMNQEKKSNDSEEFYTDSDENKTRMKIAREGSSTKLPYEEDENNASSDSESENQAANDFAIDIETPKLDSVMADEATRSKPPRNIPYDYPQHFEWTGTVENGQNTENFNLGDVLKPYLPVVLDKVFQMALRKSMVSIEADANCTPGSTTMLKCNACFCLKNNKMLCTNNKCN